MKEITPKNLPWGRDNHFGMVNHLTYRKSIRSHVPGPKSVRPGELDSLLCCHMPFGGQSLGKDGVQVRVSCYNDKVWTGRNTMPWYHQLHEGSSWGDGKNFAIQGSPSEVREENWHLDIGPDLHHKWYGVGFTGVEGCSVTTLGSRSTKFLSLVQWVYGKIPIAHALNWKKGGLVMNWYNNRCDRLANLSRKDFAPFYVLKTSLILGGSLRLDTYPNPA